MKEKEREREYTLKSDFFIPLYVPIKWRFDVIVVLVSMKWKWCVCMMTLPT